jgi:hypothetical protein
LQSHARRKYQISKFLVFVTLTGLIDLCFHFLYHPHPFRGRCSGYFTSNGWRKKY